MPFARFYITGNFAPKACVDRKPAAGAFLLSYRTIIGKKAVRKSVQKAKMRKKRLKNGEKGGNFRVK